jgi:excisionase family DNA binding protein
MPNKPKPIAPPRRWAGIGVAADYIQVNERTIRKMIADGRLTGYKSGNRLIRVDLNEIDNVLLRAFGGGVD